MQSVPDAITATSTSILLVEDDTATGEMLKTVITRKFPGVSIYQAENGRIGLDLFQEHTPGIVITDINMPVMDGIEMASRILSIKSGTRFIVMTAYSNKIYFEKFSDIGFSDYLLKPVQFPKLFAAIEKCFAEILLERQS